MRYYEQSGAVPILGLLLVLIVAGAMSVVGVIYTYIVVWIPYVYASFLATFGFGAVVGFAVGFAARLGKIRNTLVVGILGVLAAVPAYYAAWMFDPLARIGLEDGVILLDPAGIFAWMQLLYDNGSWGIAGIDAVKGPVLAGMWLIEAGIIFTLSGWCATTMISDLPFCERCRCWVNQQEDVRRLSLIDVELAVLDRLTAGHVDGFANMAVADDSEEQHLRLDLACCPTCPECNVLTIQLVKAVANKKGEVEIEILPLVENLLITKDEVNLIRTAGRARTQDELERLQNEVVDEAPEDDESAEPT